MGFTVIFHYFRNYSGNTSLHSSLQFVSISFPPFIDNKHIIEWRFFVCSIYKIFFSDGFLCQSACYDVFAYPYIIFFCIKISNCSNPYPNNSVVIFKTMNTMVVIFHSFSNTLPICHSTIVLIVIVLDCLNNIQIENLRPRILPCFQIVLRGEWSIPFDKICIYLFTHYNLGNFKDRKKAERGGFEPPVGNCTPTTV